MFSNKHINKLQYRISSIRDAIIIKVFLLVKMLPNSWKLPNLIKKLQNLKIVASK